jgi:hypothetical protein
MGMLAETTKVNYNQGQQTSIFRLQKTDGSLLFPFFRLQQTNGSCPFPLVAFSVHINIHIETAAYT